MLLLNLLYQQTLQDIAGHFHPHSSLNLYMIMCYTVLEYHPQHFNLSYLDIYSILVRATLDIYHDVMTCFIPTPSKVIYLSVHLKDLITVDDGSGN